MKTRLLILALFAATAGVVTAYPLTHSAVAVFDPNEVKGLPVIPKKPKVEVVFVLDTTGSMSGLIQAAKENIWSIASSMAQAKPAPEIRMGLVAFRDRGDEYVTRVVELSSDLDTMYATLMDFSANGGGDGPESVNQALYDAVHQQPWSQDKDAYKVVFLVGDAPPHMDYQDDVKYPETVKAAQAKGIVINTIQAGSDSNTRKEWQRIASLNQGEFFQVAQAGDAVAVDTPFDGEIAALSRELDDTRMFFGDEAAQAAAARKAEATDKLHALGSEASRAKRAAFNASAAGAKNFSGEHELVGAVSSGRVDLGAIPPAALPAPMRDLDKAEQQKLIKDTAERREKLQQKIAELSHQRSAYIADELKDSPEAEESSLDRKIYEAVKEQAAGKGLAYEAEKPAY